MNHLRLTGLSPEGVALTDRRFDIVVFGATGFTSALAAEYLARNAPPGLRWALAGRNPAKLGAIRDRVSRIRPGLDAISLVQADLADPDSLRRLAEQTRVLMNGVGPYLGQGEQVVGACAAAGTDYLDLTGEHEFVTAVGAMHHDTAVRAGSRIVHACGIESIAFDLGVWYTLRQLPSGGPLQVDGIVRVGGRLTPSGGSWATAMTLLGRPGATVRAMRARASRLSADAASTGRTVRIPLGPPRRRPELSCWAVPLPTLDQQIVAQSARDSDRYGPDFRYRHFAGLPSLWIIAAAVGLPVLIAAAQIPPVRRWLRNRQPSGTGPSAEQRAASSFSVHFSGSAAGRTVHTEVAGGDPGYGETAKVYAETALCLALDDLPPTAGQVTTAVAMGDALLERLMKADISFRTVDEA